MLAFKGGWNSENHQLWRVNWVSYRLSSFLSASTAATYIFTAPNSTTTIVSLEPCALNAEFQHFILRFIKISLLYRYRWKRGQGVKGGPKTGWSRGYFTENSIIQWILSLANALSQVTPSELSTSLALPWPGAYFRTPHVCSITLLLFRLEWFICDFNQCKMYIGRSAMIPRFYFHLRCWSWKLRSIATSPSCWICSASCSSHPTTKGGRNREKTLCVCEG